MMDNGLIAIVGTFLAIFAVMAGYALLLILFPGPAPYLPTRDMELLEEEWRREYEEGAMACYLEEVEPL